MRNRVALVDSEANPLATTDIAGIPVLNVVLASSGSIPGAADAGAITYPTDSQEIYTFRSGGISGTVLATLTINYTDSSKTSLLNWAWT